MARQLFAQGEFVELFVEAPLSLCEHRDPKGLYSKARQGKLANFTGIDSAYEPPEAPEVRLATGESSAEQSVEAVLAYLATNKFL